MYRWFSVPDAGLCGGEVAVLGEKMAIKRNYFDDFDQSETESVHLIMAMKLLSVVEKWDK